MEGREFVLWFRDLRKEHIPLVGGKCANLGEVAGVLGIPVPDGFAVTAHAYTVFLETTGAVREIETLLSGIDEARVEALQETSKRIRAYLEGLAVPGEIEKSILSAFDELASAAGQKDLAVAVRSSATAEDLPGASFAGLQDTFLNVKRKNLLPSIKKCWSSLFTPRVIAYRKEKGFSHSEVRISVAVQTLLFSKASGVMFTLEPVSGDRNRIVINASWGLGEAIVSGQVTPDEYVVEKQTERILERHVVSKGKRIVSDRKGGTTWELVPESIRDIPALTDDQIIRLARYGKAIENHYGGPQDIEWAMDEGGNLFILQVRPETVYSGGMERDVRKEEGGMEQEVLIRGIGVSPGTVSGKVRIIEQVKDAARFQKGEILVTDMTTPDWVPLMKIAGAIVTNLGGKTCHAAIVSRELGVPCIVGTEKATKLLKDGDIVTVDGRRGLVFSGVQEVRETAMPQHAIAMGDTSSHLVTATKVYVNLSIPEIARKVADETNADGVGLLRAEHLMLSIGKHPRLLLEEGGDAVMIDTFARGVGQVAEAFFPRPVVYRFLDFKPDEFLELPGGEKYERKHVGPNPMIGYRGEFRYAKEDDIFRLELKAIRRAREEKGLTNIWVMIPFVRTVEVFRKTVQIMREEGLDHRTDKSFQLWIMVEVPSAVFMIEEFCREGIDGVSFGTNDLTMLVLGVDRNDTSVQEIYDERNLGVLRAIAYTMAVCRKYGVTTSICGQAPSVYPDYLEFMIRCGATSISVNPDTVVVSRKSVAAIEQKILMENALGVRTQPKIGKIPLSEVFFWRWVEGQKD